MRSEHEVYCKNKGLQEISLISEQSLSLSACVGVVAQPYSAGYLHEYDGYGDGYFYPGGYYFLNGYYQAGYYYRHHDHYRGHYPYGVRIHYRPGQSGHRDHDADRHRDFKRQRSHRDHAADRQQFSKRNRHPDRKVTNIKFGSRQRVVDATDRHQRHRIDTGRQQVGKGNDLRSSDRRLRVKVRGLQAGISHKTDLSRKVISHRNQFKGGKNHFTGGWNDRRRGPSMHRGSGAHGRRLIGDDSRGRGGFEKRGRADRKGFCIGRTC